MIPYFERFLEEFPEVADLAAAPLDRVLELWAGLGYYSRARNLHRGAQALATRLKSGPGFPRTAQDWLEIPGVGPYTAGAIASIAFCERAPIVDGNVVRVLSRVHAIPALDSAKSEIWKHARRLVENPEANPRVLNQALMELGALVCRPRNPQCESCPIRSSCKGKSSPERYPQKEKKKDWKRVSEEKWIPVRVGPQGRLDFFLVRNAEGSWREGLWDFPDSGSVRLKQGELWFEFDLNYVVTRHKVQRAHRVMRVPGKTKIEKSVRADSDAGWHPLQKLPAVPAPVRKAISRVERALAGRST